MVHDYNRPDTMSGELKRRSLRKHGSLPPLLLLGVIVVLGGLLRMDGLREQPLLGDELEDLSILQQLSERPNPFEPIPAGEEIAADQARLPFYLTAIASRVTGRSSLRFARAVSVLFALLVIVLVYLLGSELFDRRVGLVAAALQAVSIYDIGFSRLALTSSSSLFVGLYLLSLLALYRAWRTGRLRWLWGFGIAAGFATAAKFFGVFGLVVAGGWFLLVDRPSTDGPPVDRGAWRPLIMANALGLLIFALLAVVSLPPGLEALLFGTTALALVAIHLGLVPRASAPLYGIPRPVLAAGVLSLAVLYAFIGSPYHLDLSRLAAIFEVFPEWHRAGYADTSIRDFAVIVMVRMRLPFNLLLLLGLGRAVRARREPRQLLLLLAFAIPFTILSLVRFKVTWYLMMVFPVSYLMIAALLVHWSEGSRALRRPARWAAVVVGVAMLGYYGYRVVTIRPFYQIDGYQMGRDYVGWNRPGFVSFELVPEAVAWMESHLPEGSEVGCLLTDLPRYNRYALYHVAWYSSGDRVRFRRADTLEDAVSSPYVLLSLYSEEYAPVLQAIGYEPQRSFLLRGFPYATLYRRAE